MGVLPSITNEVLKAVVAQFDAGELITQRENLSAKVKSDLVGRSEQFGVVLDDIAITHLTFGREFTQAVEQKQVAQQEAEKARFLVEKAEQVKTAAIINAEGDSEAASLLAKAFKETGEGLVFRRTPAVGPLEKGSEKGETPVLVGCASIARVVGVELLGIAADHSSRVGVKFVQTFKSG